MTGIVPDGYTILPHGKLANSVTWLEMLAPFPQRALAPQPDLALEPLRGGDAARYLAIYRVLAHRWLWAGRLETPQRALAAWLDDPGAATFALTRSGADAGLLELDLRAPEGAELAYFGIFDQLIGRGAGGWLMQAAIAEVARRDMARLFVHTCNFDHPGALGFYRAHGFVPYQTGFEIMDDPRHAGLLPLDAAPHVPLVGSPASRADD